jgi:hypothetical protein
MIISRGKPTKPMIAGSGRISTGYKVTPQTPGNRKKLKEQELAGSRNDPFTLMCGATWIREQL